MQKKCLTLSPLFIHTTFTLMVLNYSCHICLWADWQRRGTQSAAKWHFRQPPNIHLHSYEAMWDWWLAQGYNNRRGWSCIWTANPFIHWTTHCTSWSSYSRPRFKTNLSVEVFHWQRQTKLSLCLFVFWFTRLRHRHPYDGHYYRPRSWHYIGLLLQEVRNNLLAMCINYSLFFKKDSRYTALRVMCVIFLFWRRNWDIRWLQVFLQRLSIAHLRAC